MFRIITTFDSWHLNGVHCPSIKVGLPKPTLEEAIAIYNECNYKLDNYVDDHKKPLTLEYLKECYSKEHNYIYAFDYRIEGYVVIVND